MSYTINFRSSMPMLTQHLETVLNSTEVSIYCKDKNGKYLEFNDAFLNISGAKKYDDVIGSNDFDFWEKYAPFMQKNDSEVFSTHLSKTIIEPSILVNKNEQVFYLSHKVPLRARSGKIIGVFGQSVLYNQSVDLVNQLKQLPFSPQELSNAESATNLSKRQIQCLYYLIRGYTAKQIGKSLGLSNKTVEFYFSNLKKKLGCNSRMELIKKTINLFHIQESI